MKFLCDYMLVRVGRWLRAAGYDTIIAEEGEDDPSLLARAIEENRTFITRDRLIPTLPNAEGTVLCLKENSVDGCAHELSRKLPIDWLKAPFSRCLLCNTPLVETDEAPEDVEASIFWKCPSCRKTYWEGSHTNRMRRKLESWQNSLSS